MRISLLNKGEVHGMQFTRTELSYRRNTSTSCVSLFLIRVNSVGYCLRPTEFCYSACNFSVAALYHSI
jgi:hypothetical protein